MKIRSDKGVSRFSDVEMISRHSMPEPNSGCWFWLGNLNSWGYGRLGKHRSERQAHRLSFSAHCAPIPSGMKVCHRCDIPCCVNPDHLFLGSQTENMRDMAAKGRTGVSCGSDNRQAKLNPERVAEIRSARRSDIARLAERFGVSRRAAVAFVMEGKTWATK